MIGERVVLSRRNLTVAFAVIAVAALVVVGLTTRGSSANQSASATHDAAQSHVVAHASGSCSTSTANGSCIFPQDTTDFPGINLGSGRPASQGVEIDQNVWNANGCPGWTQTLSANSTQNFAFTANYPKSSSGAICSYPNEWPHDAQGPIDAYSQTTSTFSESFPHNAQTQAHAMYDLWFDNWAYEVMVQYDFSNDAPCEGSWPEVKTNVTFGGSNGVPTQSWHLCEGNGGKSLIWKLGAADGSQEQSESSGSVDLLPMLKYLESNGYLPAGSTWTALSMGWEIASTGGQPETFANSEFRVSMITGGEANSGYWLVGSDGGIFNFGAAGFYGSTGSMTLQRPVVGITPTNDNRGYWLVASDGGVFSYGDSTFVGSLPGLGFHPAGSGLPHSLDQPIVGIVPSANGQGYYMVAADGGVFAFNSVFAGSCPGIGGCAGAAVAVAPDASGKGYWLATNSGQIYAFGNAKYFGAPGTQSSKITSMVRTPDGGGYYIVDGLGQVFAYGDAVWRGNLPAGAAVGFDPATAIAATADGQGYWITTALGKIYPFGDAPNDGDMSGTHLNGAIIAAAGF
jgi:hypothetical protein